MLNQETKREAVILSNILFEHPNEKAKKRLTELFEGCSLDEQRELTSMGIHPKVTPRMKEFLMFKKSK